MNDNSSYQVEVSLILKAVNSGEPDAANRLIEFAYEELKQIARHHLGKSAPNESISPTVLVNEMYMKMIGANAPANWNGRGHFFSAVARAMRQILIDHARKKQSQKRGGDRFSVDLDLSMLPNLKKATADEIVSLNDSLEVLGKEDPETMALVELKCFSGHTTSEAAELLNISLRTADRRWQYAKARLYQLMSPDSPDSIVSDKSNNRSE